MVTHDTDWKEDCADEAGAQGRYWWHARGRNPNAKSNFEAVILEALKSGATEVGKLKAADFNDDDVKLRAAKTAAVNGITQGQARTRLKTFLTKVPSGTDLGTLTWYQLQYAMLPTNQGGGNGAYKAAADARQWWIDNLTPNGQKFADWRPQWLKDADPLS